MNIHEYLYIHDSELGFMKKDECSHTQTEQMKKSFQRLMVIHSNRYIFKTVFIHR